MAEIPTMPCPECRDVADPWGWCADCDEAGRVPRPPLSLAEIADLPDGALVVVEVGGALYPVRVRTRFGGMRVYRFGRVGRWRVLACRSVWVAAEDADG